MHHAHEFHEAKKFAIAGLTTGIFVYQVLYVIILNEWFDMEYSAQRNAYDWAQTNIEYMFLGLIYLMAAKDTEQPVAQASFPATALALALGLRNTSTFPSITITRPTSAGAVH